MANIRKIAGFVFVFLIVIGAVTVYYFSSKNDSKALCRDVIIKIKYKTEKPLINETDIYRFLKIADKKKHFINKPTNKIEIKKIEYTLRKTPQIKSADVYINISKELVLEIEQRTPLLRILTTQGNGYFLCDDLKKIPLSSHYSPYITPVSGNVNAKMDKKLYALAVYVNNNSFWKDQIQQYFVSENDDISFIPTTGAHEVIIGDTNNLDEKFKKLETFYQNGLNKIGWEKYKTINLKFKGQVICK
ncbi:MAG: hypothetical protein HUU47_07875 [Bacteroidetes bacterium]|nr:hypothetical protein [Bacteroidota bacterium]